MEREAEAERQRQLEAERLEEERRKQEEEVMGWNTSKLLMTSTDFLNPNIVI